MSERLWGVNVSVNEIFVFSFLSCDYPLQRGGCHLLVTAKSWYEEKAIRLKKVRPFIGMSCESIKIKTRGRFLLRVKTLCRKKSCDLKKTSKST